MRWAVVLREIGGETVREAALQVRGDPLQSTDGHRLAVDAVAPTGRLTGSVAGASENSRKDVGLAVQHVGVVELSLGDHPDVPGHAGVRRPGPHADVR